MSIQLPKDYQGPIDVPASEVRYNDLVKSPSLGANNVQAAIDSLKSVSLFVMRIADGNVSANTLGKRSRTIAGAVKTWVCATGGVPVDGPSLITCVILDNGLDGSMVRCLENVGVDWPLLSDGTAIGVGDGIDPSPNGGVKSGAGFLGFNDGPAVADGSPALIPVLRTVAGGIGVVRIGHPVTTDWLVANTSGTGFAQIELNSIPSTLISWGANLVLASGADLIISFLDQAYDLGYWNNLWKTVWSKIFASGVGPALIISGNTIAPTYAIHSVGAGVLKTIAPFDPHWTGSIVLRPTAAFTYDSTGNILGSGLAVVGRDMTATYDGAKWAMSY